LLSLILVSWITRPVLDRRAFDVDDAASSKRQKSRVNDSDYLLLLTERAEQFIPSTGEGLETMYVLTKK
jgi:hypothetical protein